MSGEMEKRNTRKRAERYGRTVHRALDEAYERAEKSEVQADLATAKYVVFSDQHKGARDGADDFRRCEQAYNAALGYYLEAGHTLVVLGDAEELWESTPPAVLQAYRHTLELEAEFHRCGRYLRVFGNHDDLWATELAVHTLLHPIFPDLRVHEGVRVRVTDQGRTAGTLFLVHGHQGEPWSDRWSRLARLPVRYLWPSVQRLTGFSYNTPARDFQLRKRRDVAMYGWAEKKGGVVLIGGHTHAPIFRSQPRALEIDERLQEARAALAASPGDPGAAERVSLLRAEMEWVFAQENQVFEHRTPMSKPCYFNSGCCCFVDGHITGLEIEHGRIRLVRWPDREGKPAPYALESASLKEVFATC